MTGPLGQTPPNKLTEVLWGLVNCIPTLVGAVVLLVAPGFTDYNLPAMTTWLVVIIVAFAIVFAVNSSIHSFLVVNYAAKEKVAVSVGFYYMSNALGRLMGTLGSGLLYTYVGRSDDAFNEFSGNNAVDALAACFIAGTISSLLAALITLKIQDDKGGLKCGSCCTLVKATSDLEDGDEKKDEQPENWEFSREFSQEFSSVAL